MSDNHYNIDELVRSYISKAFKYLVGLAAVCFVLAMSTLIIFMTVYGAKGFGISTFSLTSANWDPKQQRFGIGGFIIVSVLILILALAFSIVLAVPYMYFLRIYFRSDSKIRRGLERFAQMLAGIPSVFFGLLGYSLLHSLLGMNLSILMTSVVLAIMILPNHVLFIGIYMNSINNDLIHNSLSLGATKLESVLHLYTPKATIGLLIGSIVAVTRILSETMAVSMILGNSRGFSWNILGGARNLTSLIAMQFGEATGQWRNALYAVGLIVLLLSFSIHILVFVVQSLSFKKLVRYIFIWKGIKHTNIKPKLSQHSPKVSFKAA